MKKLLIGLLALGSVSAFANILNVDATNDEIRDAIIISLQENDLDCTGTHALRASSLMLAKVYSSNYTLKISEDHSQPVITMEKRGTKSKNVTIVTTDQNFKVVTRLVVKSYDNVGMKRVNIGTILEPVYKEIEIDGKPFEDFVCE